MNFVPHWAVSRVVRIVWDGSWCTNLCKYAEKLAWSSMLLVLFSVYSLYNVGYKVPRAVANWKDIFSMLISGGNAVPRPKTVLSTGTQWFTCYVYFLHFSDTEILLIINKHCTVVVLTEITLLIAEFERKRFYLIVSHLLLKFSNELLNLNLVNITAWLEIQRRCKIERGPQFFYRSHDLKITL